MTPSALAHVMEFAHRHRERELEPLELHRLGRLVVDALACIHSGWDERAAERARRWVGIEGGKGGHRDWAFAWGVALRDLDYLDVYASRDICHPSENVAVALGLAQEADAPGASFLKAVAVGYEVQCQLADAVDLRKAGIHHAAAASLTVPVMANRLGLLADDHLLDAMAIALARGVTLRSISRGKVSQVKAFAFPLSARSAREAGDLAGLGVTGPEQVLNDVVDLAGGEPGEVIAAFQDPGPAASRLGGVAIKTSPVQYALQGVVECGVQLAHALQSDLDRITALHVIGGPRVTENTSDPEKRVPVNRETADHSLFSTLSIAVASGRCGVHELLGGAWEQPAVRRLAPLVTISPAGAPVGEAVDVEAHPLWVRVTAVLEDGRRVERTVLTPTGTPDNPVGDRQLDAKLVETAAPNIGPEGAKKLLERARRLPSASSVRDLPGVGSITGV